MKTIQFLFLGLLCMLSFSCERFLEVRSSNTLGIPSKLRDLRALLDYEFDVNEFYPGIIESAADDYYLNHKGFSGLKAWNQDAYIWEDRGLDDGCWQHPYKVITIANVVLETLARIDEHNDRLRRQLEGEALFLRGVALFYLAQLYAPPFLYTDEGSEPGLVIRHDSDVNVRVGRSTVRETYKQIFEDMHGALELLPLKSEYVTRPSRLAAMGMLARMYLAIGDYVRAEDMAEGVLEEQDGLLDFKTLDASSAYPFSINGNRELIYTGSSSSAAYNILNSNAFVSPELYALYEEGDLRKGVYFTESTAGVKFKGYYHGIRTGYFAGVAVDELYLVMAECLARREETVTATGYLNGLLAERYDEGTFTDLVFSDAEQLLRRVLEERRKELVFRGIRWMDLRRLNRDARFAVTLVREMNDGTQDIVYTLEPNSLRYTFLIPIGAVSIGHYTQSPR